MLHARRDGAGDQRARLGGVVEIIAERIGDRLRDDDLRREMHDRVDLMPGQQIGDQRLVPEITGDQRHVLRQRAGEAGRQVVQHHDPLARIVQRPDHVAADIARPARDQNRHAVSRAPEQLEVVRMRPSRFPFFKTARAGWKRLRAAPATPYIPPIPSHSRISECRNASAKPSSPSPVLARASCPPRNPCRRKC